MDFLEEVKRSIDNGDTELMFAKEPIVDNYPKEEGIFFIYNKIIELENITTENIANVLLKYISFIKKHKIQIIKNYDTNCSLAYQGEIPNIKVESFETQSFYGFNKFQIINAETLSRKDEKNKLYLKGIDFTYALDSNAASFFEKYYNNNDSRYESLYNEIMADGNNIDIAPYIFETILNGINDFGIYYKLNKKNKNATQAGFFQNVSTLCKAGLFKEKKVKNYINSLIKSTNPLVSHYGILGYGAHIFLIIMLEAKYKFPESSNKIKNYVYSEMRKERIPIENKLKAILYLFSEKPGHMFFEKVINVKSVQNLDKYLKNVNNTARDIALSLLEKNFYANMNLFSFLATDDEGFIKMLQETQPDYIFKYDGMETPVYIQIIQDMKKKHLEFFETDSAQKTVNYEDTSLKDLINAYKKRLSDFVEIISTTTK